MGKLRLSKNFNQDKISATMNTILFVTGTQGVGKTTFIANHFAKREGYFVLDLCRISQKLFGTTAAFGDDRLADIYNQATEEAMDALMEDKVLVVEYGLAGYDDDFLALVKAAKSNGFRVEINQITADKDLASVRFLDRRGAEDFLPFDRIREDLLEILTGIIECMAFNHDWERVCHLSGPGVSVDFFKTEQEGRTMYFFVTEEKKYFVFDQRREDAEFDDVELVQKYGSFSEALGALQEKIPLAGLYPSQIKDGYLKAVKEAYLKYLSSATAVFAKDWEIFLN
jgi:predicted ABC-type ATPase